MCRPLFLISLFVPYVWSHARIINPPSRPITTTVAKVCNQQLYNDIVDSDSMGPFVFPAYTDPNNANYIDPATHPECHPWSGKGASYLDVNSTNTIQFAVGQTFQLGVDFLAAHTWTDSTTGESLTQANISIVDAVSGAMILPLVQLPSDYGWSQTNSSPPVTISPKDNMPVSQRRIPITIPDLGGKCTKLLECAIHFYWHGLFDQVFASLLDFVIVETAVHPSVPTSSTAGSMYLTQQVGWNGQTKYLPSSNSKYAMGQCVVLANEVPEFEGKIGSMGPDAGACCMLYQDDTCGQDKPDSMVTVQSPGSYDMQTNIEASVWDYVDQIQSYKCIPINEQPGRCYGTW